PRPAHRAMAAPLTTTREARSERGTRHHVLLPVLVAQEILSRKLALSEGGGALEERDVDQADALGAGALGDFLRHHLTHERNRNAPETMQHFFRTSHARAGQYRPLRRR